jgi:uncharacterized protein
MNKYIEALEKLFIEKNICQSHGIGHAITVMYNAENALRSNDYNLNVFDCRSVLLAALLHDADDRKFFPENKNFENLRFILKDETPEMIDQVITMVDLVSSSKNGDSVPAHVAERMWMLIPRYSDRIEAFGLVGIKRVFQYAKTVNNPLYVSTSPKPNTEEEIWANAAIERYRAYSGHSDSMIDHFYDKLLRATNFPIKNVFLNTEAKARTKPMIDFLLMFASKDELTDIDVMDFLDNYHKKLFGKQILI